jgi:hypothetical protein
MVLVRIQALCEAPEGIGFPHTRKRREDSDTADVFQVVEPDIHLVEVPGTETVFFLELLFVKGIEGEAVKRVIDHVSASDL